MNQHYLSFIQLGRQLAEDRAIPWQLPVGDDGTVSSEECWNLNKLVKNDHPPYCYLRDFGCDAKSMRILEAQRTGLDDPQTATFVLSEFWQDLIKAAVCIQLFSKRNTVTHVAQNIIRPLRVIATCTPSKAPWDLVSDDVQLAMQVATAIQPSGKLGDLVAGLVKTIFDAYHLTNAGPLYPALANQRLKGSQSRKAKHIKSEDELRHDLDERKRAERLPERRAFWELIRIVMTERPQTFVDELRFIGLKTMIATGFRIGENVLLPLDWERRREYTDRNGRPAGELGGISGSLMIRHFAEKQQIEGRDSHVLFESTQHVPPMFEDLIVSSLGRAAELTTPLRATLRLQVESGRLLPWFEADSIVPITQLYPYLTGNPFWTDLSKESRTRWIERYQKNFDSRIFDELRDIQAHEYFAPGGIRLDMAAYQYFNRLGKAMGTSSIRYRRGDGSVIPLGTRMNWAQAFLHVRELEDYLRENTPTKLSDTEPFILANGTMQAWEVLLLHPKRSLAEERNAGLCDVTRYMAVNVPDPTFISLSLAPNQGSGTLFFRYGQTDEDRRLTLNSHSLRHLQNTELFRLGIADTIISKRFNRRSVAQSYEYDHRSLAEELDTMEIPMEVEFALGEKATTVAKMIASGKARGPIVDAFERIQATEGDAAAFEYLKVEADGFHATPYGHCLNSFTVDPCPKHLECFAGCRHLSATNLPEPTSPRY